RRRATASGYPGGTQPLGDRYSAARTLASMSRRHEVDERFTAPADGAGSGRGPLIEAIGLTKQFGSFTAVDAIDFEVRQGEAFGSLGPTGAGKSSTMRMVGCVSPISGGTLRILGMDPAVDGPRIRARLGVVPQQDSLDEELTLRENLIVYGRY